MRSTTLNPPAVIDRVMERTRHLVGCIGAPTNEVNLMSGQIDPYAWRDALIRRHPTLFGRLFDFSTPPGWERLVTDLVEEIASRLTADESERCRVVQLKEKFGTLRCYTHDAPEWVRDLVDRAEGRSARICDVCGQPGEPRNLSGWLQPRCDAHAKREPL